MVLSDCKFITVTATSVSEVLSMMQTILPAFEFIYDVAITQDASQGLWFGTVYGKGI